MQASFLFIICGKRGILSPLRFESDFVDDEPPSGSHPSPAAFAFFLIKKETYLQASFLFIICGKRGIRTPGTVTRTPHFECGPIDHSGIFPNAGAKVAFFLQTTKKNPFFLRYTLHFFCECQKKCILRVFTYCVIENIVVILPSEIICIFNISIRNS